MVWKGKLLLICKHAHEGMYGETPPIKVEHISYALDNPDYTDGRQYCCWIGKRTVIVYVSEYGTYWEIDAVSATRRKIKRDGNYE